MVCNITPSFFPSFSSSTSCCSCSACFQFYPS
jgi:hypothetical protein